MRNLGMAARDSCADCTVSMVVGVCGICPVLTQSDQQNWSNYSKILLMTNRSVYRNVSPVKIFVKPVIKFSQTRLI